MFIRQTKSRKSTCFQIGKKTYGKFVLLKHIGCAATPSEIEALKLKAKEELTELLSKNQLRLFSDVKTLPKAKLLSWHITGFHQVFGTVYDRLGFPGNILRDLVIGRIVYPRSKTATIRYLKRYLGISFSKDRIYRFLDTLNKDVLTKIAFNFVSQKNKGVSILFYDVTTLHFETDIEDDLRKKGFSKNHRTDVPQIMVGLFVDNEGFPFDFDFFKGSIFEGHTFPVAIKKIIAKYTFDSLTVVADAAMLSTDNLEFLESLHINYIVGARLKNLPLVVIEKIHNHDFLQKPIFQIVLKSQKLFIDYSSQRAQKDAKTRKRLIERLKIKLSKKEAVIHKSKYLKWEEQGKIAGIDKEKIEADKKFDGLKGYVTNKNIILDPLEIIKQYRNLWNVEKAFRMSKSDLKERPIYHRYSNRIKSHLLICFVSLLVMKETERILNRKKYSLEKAMEMLGTVGEGKTRIGNICLDIDSELDQETQSILQLFTGH